MLWWAQAKLVKKSAQFATVEKDVEQTMIEDKLVQQQNIPQHLDGLPAAENATSQPSRVQLVHLAKAHSLNLDQPITASAAVKDKNSLYVIPAKKKLQFHNQLSASDQFQKELNSIPLSSLHCLNHS